MLSFVSCSLAAVFAFGVPDVEPGQIRIDAPIYKSKVKKGVTSYSAFASKKPFLVTIRLYSEIGGFAVQDESGQAWTETLHVFPNTASLSDSIGSNVFDPLPVKGRVSIVLGRASPLPPWLLSEDVCFTTQVATLSKDGVIQTTFSESPMFPLGASGHTRDQVLALAGLRLPEGAAPGRVLTADALGNAHWEEPELPPLPNGTVGRIARFGGAAGLIDSALNENDLIVSCNKTFIAGGGFQSALTIFGPGCVLETGAFDTLDANGATFDDLAANVAQFSGSVVAKSSLAVGNGPTVVIAGGGITMPGDVTLDDVLGDAALMTSVVASSDLSVGPSGNTIITGGNITTQGSLSAQQSVTAGANLIANSTVRAGAPTVSTFSAGDVGAQDDLFCDDDLIVGDDLTVRGGFILSETAATTSMTLRANADMRFVKDNDQGGNFTNDFQWWDGGTNESLGADIQMQLKDGGNLTVDGTLTGGGADLAEYYPTRFHDGTSAPGTVVAVDADAPAHVRPARLGLNEAVLGIVSTRPGVLIGNGTVEGANRALVRAAFEAFNAGFEDEARLLFEQWNRAEAARTDRVPVALSGRVPVLVDASRGAIRAGDRLGLGHAPGRAARYTGEGPVIGMALEDWTETTSTVLAFVKLEWAPVAGVEPRTTRDR